LVLWVTRTPPVGDAKNASRHPQKKDERRKLHGSSLMETRPDEVTRLLSRLGTGDCEAWKPLMEAVYEELRLLARRHMRGESSRHTLQPTALVHEAFLRLVADEKLRFRSRGHFFAVASKAMERILADHARRKRAAKRNGDRPVFRLDDVRDPDVRSLSGRDDETDAALDADLLAEALGELEGHEHIHGQRKAIAVRLRYFLACSLEEIAEIQGASVDTVERDLKLALAFLRKRLGPQEGSPAEGSRI
jgi:RNA polymerase sigma factor (TIGR02999 family)